MEEVVIMVYHKKTADCAVARKEKIHLLKYFRSLDTHRYYRILDSAQNTPFYLDPAKMFTMREHSAISQSEMQKLKEEGSKKK